MAKIKSGDSANTGKDAEKFSHSCVADGGINDVAILEDSLANSLKKIQPNSYTFGHLFLGIFRI